MNKVTVKDGEREKIGVGSMWERQNFKYKVFGCSGDDGRDRVILCCLETGIIWESEVFFVDNKNNISKNEWERITSNQSKQFTRIYHVEIESERD